jgi:hypothetical protein
MTFTILKGENIGYSETVQITAIPIRPCVFMVYWIEADGTTVVHVEDFAKSIVYTNITQPDGTFFNLKGTLTKVLDLA